MRVVLTQAIPGGSTIRVSVDSVLRDPNNASLRGGQTAWNTFGYVYRVDDTDAPGGWRQIGAEAARVGVRICEANLEINRKVDASTGNPLSGAVFGVFNTLAGATSNNAADRIMTLTTDGSGIARTSGLMTGRTYFVREITPPSGYMASGTVHTVNLSRENWRGVSDNVVVVGGGNLVNSRAPLTLSLTKAFASGVPVPAGGITINITGVFAAPYQPVPITRTVHFTQAQVNAGAVLTIDRIIAGNSYVITETPNDYSMTITPDGAGVTVSGTTITASANGKFDIVNNRAQAGELNIAKRLLGAPNTGQTYRIRVD